MKCARALNGPPINPHSLLLLFITIPCNLCMFLCCYDGVRDVCSLSTSVIAYINYRTDQFDMTVYKSSSNTHFSATDNAWICYRQNQFKVYCLLKR